MRRAASSAGFARGRLGAVAAALCLAGAALGQDEVPFITTPDQVTRAMLELARVGSADHVIDLGSGDGRIVITAAKRFGARGLGVEIVPELVQKSRELARAAGVHDRVEFHEQDLFATDLGGASVVTMYLLPDVNLQLRPKLLKLRPGTRVISHDWDMGDWQPDKTVVLDVPDKAVGLEKKSRVHLWIVPARVQGDYCGTGKAKGRLLRLAQEYQRFRGRFEKGDEAWDFQGRIDGATLRAPRDVNIRQEGQKLRVQAISKVYSAVHGATFVPAKGPTCK